jgi:WD40 repeat protein/serine/threonine protein kinase
MDMSIDEMRSLLFGMLAHQLRSVSPAVLAQCASAWLTDRDRGIPERLVEGKWLSETDRDLLNRMLDEAIRAHGGDIRATIASFGGEERISQTFLGRIPFAADDSKTIQSRGEPLGELDEEHRAVDETPGRYTTVSEYARGGMGRVLLVHDEHLSREIAMKELLPFAAAGGETITPRQHAMTVVSRFLQEARITGQLEHPSIVPVYELGRHADGTLYYTMKLVRGRTLSEVLRDLPNLNDRLALLPHFLDLCQAVAYAHSRGIIHRDLKPGNIMIGEFGETVVLDWGLAKALHDAPEKQGAIEETLRALELSPSVDSPETINGQVLGTPAYMAPEQAGGNLALVNERSDVYSLGAILYEMMTGRRPYDRGKPADVLRDVLSGSPVPATHVERATPSELAAICERAMSRDPQRRYADAKELATEIERFQTGAFVVAYRYSLADYLRRWVQRHRTAALTAAVAALILVATSVFYTVNLKHANRLLALSRDEERIQRVSAENQGYLSAIRLASEYIDSHLMDRANEALWSAPEHLRNWEWGYLLNRANQSVFTLPGCSIGRYSPDGARIATASRENGVQLWDAQSGALIASVDDSSAPRIMALEFSPDGALLAVGGMDGNVRLWRTDSLEPSVTLGPRQEVILNICFSNDGDRLLAVGDDGLVELWDVTTGSRIRTLQVPATVIFHAEFSSDSSLILTHGRDQTMVWSEESIDPLCVIPGTSTRFRPSTHEFAVVRGSEVVGIDGETGEETGFRAVHVAPLNTITYSPNGAYLVTAGSDGNSVIYGAEDGRAIATLAHGEPIHGTAFSPNSSVVVTFSSSGVFKLWHVPSRTEIARFIGHTDAAREVMFSPDSERLLSLGLDRIIHVWNVRAPLNETVVADVDERISRIEVSTTGLIAFGVSRGEVHVFNRDTRAGLGAFTSFTVRPSPDYAFSPDGSLLCTVIDGFTPLIWRVEQNELVTRIEDSSQRINHLIFSPDSALLAIGYWDGTLRVFDVQSEAEVLRSDGRGDTITALAFLPDSSRLISGSRAGSVSIWDISTSEKIQELEGHQAEISSIAVSPDGDQLLIADLDRDVLASNISAGSDTTSGESAIRASRIFFMGNLNRVCGLGVESGIGRISSADTGQEFIAIENDALFVSGTCFDSNQAILLTANSDTIRALRAAPWNLDDRLGASTDSWQRRFEDYRNQSISRELFLIPYTGASKVVFAIPRNILTTCLAAISDAYRSSPEHAIDESLAENLEFTGIRAGDRMVGLNGISFGTRETDTEIERINATLANGDMSTTRLKVIRRDRTLEIDYLVLDILDVHDRVELAANRIPKLLGHCVDLLEQNRAVIAQLNSSRNQRLQRLTGADSPSSGFHIVDVSNLADRQTLSELHLYPGDCILSIDGAPIVTANDMAQRLNLARERLQSVNQTTIEFDIMRGAFQHVDLIVSMH